MKITKAQLSRLIKEELEQQLEQQGQEQESSPQKQSKGDVVTLEKAIARIDQAGEMMPATQVMLNAIKNFASSSPGLKAKIRQALIDTAKEVASSK